MLTGQQVQRLNSHIAQIKPQFFEVLTGAAGRIAAAFPAARAGLELHTPSQRYHAAERTAHVLKHLAELDQLEGWLREAGAELSRRGIDSAAAGPVAVRAILDHVRAASGEQWTPELENDWRAFLTIVTSGLAQGCARRLASVRLAA